MKKLIVFLLVLAFSACMPQPLTLVPVETLVAQTMAAIPHSATPSHTATQIPPPTPTLDFSTPTPGIDLTIAGAYCIPTNTQRKQALVTKILDAASIEVVTATETFRVRYIGLDAPKISPTLEWQSPQAIAANERMVGGKYVILVQDATDMDGTGYYPRYVIVGGTFVNHELVRLGFARAVALPPDVSCENSFLSAQVEAQTLMVGIWIATPIPTFTITPTPTITNTPLPTRATATSERACNCNYAPFSCGDFRTHSQAQACFNYCKRMGYGKVLPDNNKNGIVCEGLP